MRLPQFSKQTKKKALVATGVTTAVGLASIGGALSITAMSASAENTKDIVKTSLADKIAERFNLNKDDVQKVIDENKQEYAANRHQKLEERLNKAVEQGKITAEQKTAIINKHQEVRDYMESIKDTPQGEKRELMKAKLDELKKWAEDNGLGQYAHLLKIYHSEVLRHHQ